ncbi:hypothetical protein [Streptomyces sp. DH24]|uniref:hypothetical protein n=1 Tax=Streptomyces sp. DH24 TaxID=3040123 RepID=UPI002442A685|nr:hypothetical protein [Streptomyces sp. DH24]MDG9717810.1 hypothetical protein [Streptomyces sp. DH24]
MKQRGRHRRRRRGRALRGALAGAALALTAAATMISASQATVAEGPRASRAATAGGPAPSPTRTTDAPGALKPLTSAAETGKLRLTERPVTARSERLASALGRAVGVGAVLADADRTLRDRARCTSRERAALPVSPAATRAYCWDDADTAGWRPGAVTTSGDADDDGHWGDHRVILSAWSRQAPEGRDPARGTSAGDGLARVAFVDADDPERLAYTWVLLAAPAPDGRDLRGLESSVSGMVWYQDKLLVTAGRADRTALYVYDVDRIRRATDGSDAAGLLGDDPSAYGCRYVLTPVASYRLSGGDGAPRPDSVSLDRSTAPDSLALGDWVPSDGDGRTRLWRYPFSGDPARAGLLDTDAAGHVTAGEAYESGVTGVQGVFAHRAAWYLGRPAGDGHGALWRQDTDGARPARCGTDRTHRCWSGPAASLSHWTTTGEVWSQSSRTLFAVPLASLTGTGDEAAPAR